MQLDVSEVIDRPLADVFRFYAVRHVQNHPRWDPDMELEQLTEGPIGVGTVIRRRHTHYGEPIEGTMEVVEYNPDRAFGVVIHDGPVEILGRMRIEPSAERGRGSQSASRSQGAPTRSTLPCWSGLSATSRR
jgi:hypothetical protein